jgi:soluble lytic murein transglycosylase-like protein
LAKRGDGRRGTHGAWALIAAWAAIALASQAWADVIEIESDGQVVVLQGPRAPPAPRARPRRAAQSARSGGASREETRTLVGQAAEETALSPSLLAAVAWRESAFRQDARSRAGAVGVMQLMPGTARDLGVDPTNAAQNVSGGARYLKALLARYDGDIVRALTAYNAGPGRADRWGGAPPSIKETRNYVAAILERLSQEAEGRGALMQETKR